MTLICASCSADCREEQSSLTAKFAKATQSSLRGSRYSLRPSRLFFACLAVKSFPQPSQPDILSRYPGEFHMRGLQNKRVLITGGASGIGAATAARFLEEGARVVVLDRDEKGRAEIQRLLPKLSGTVAADVSSLAAGAGRLCASRAIDGWRGRPHQQCRHLYPP